MHPDDEPLYGTPCWWRVTSLQARVGPLDARILLALALLVLWPSWITVAIAAAAGTFFGILLALDIRPESALRAAKARLAGPLRPATFRPPREMLSMAWEDVPTAPPGPRPPKPPPGTSGESAEGKREIGKATLARWREALRRLRRYRLRRRSPPGTSTGRSSSDRQARR